MPTETLKESTARTPATKRRVRNVAAIMLRRLGTLLATPERLLTSVALVIGTVTGLGAIGFSWLMDVVTEFYFADVADYLRGHGLYPWLLPLLPMSGALLVGLITFYLAPEAEGHGVPEVMDAMARKGGRIRPRVAGAKAVASALTIGSGGAAGTEGPIIQIGAAIGSGLGQWLRVSLNDTRVMIGCGAAAGIASIFNAPIAGVLFAVEVLLRDVSLRNFVPIILAAVLSSTVTQAFAGANEPIFPVAHELFGVQLAPTYEFTVSEFGNYLLLGLLCGMVGLVIIKALYATEDAFRKLPVHRILRPVVGAALLGLAAIGVQSWIGDRVPTVTTKVVNTGAMEIVERDAHGDPPAIMGNGYPIIEQALQKHAYGEFDHFQSWTIWALLALLAAKLLAVCLTLGSGGSGGVFAPSLVMGATFGGAFGLAIVQIPWFESGSPGAYALVGMAAVVAATIHAPLTATIMLFELTRDYKVVLPIMLAAVAALAVAQWLEPASIYTLKLIRRGVRIASGDLRALQRIAVRDIRRQAAPTVRPQDPVDKLTRLMRTTTANDFVVLDVGGKLLGMVLGDDLRTMLLEHEAMPLLTVSDVMHDDLPIVGLDETLDVVMDKFAGRRLHALPVQVDSESGKPQFELVTRVAVMNRYHESLDESTAKKSRRAAAKATAGPSPRNRPRR